MAELFSPDAVDDPSRLIWPPVGSGLRPRLMRYLFLSGEVRGALMLSAVATVLTVILLFLGRTLWGQGGVRTPMLGAVLFIAGLLAGLITLLVVSVSLASIPRDLRRFRNDPMVPGVVVSLRPRQVMILIETGQAIPGASYSLSRIEPRTLGPGPVEIGSRIPCYTHPVVEYEADNIHQVYADVVACGTSDAFDLQGCVERIGGKRFQLLEQALRAGHKPEGGFHQIFLDRDLNYVGCWVSRFDNPPNLPERKEGVDGFIPAGRGHSAQA